MELRPVHVASLIAMVATAAIVTGCGGALQQTATSASTAANPYTSLFNVSADPLQACLQQGGRYEILLDGTTRKCTIEVVRGKQSTSTIAAPQTGSWWSWGAQQQPAFSLNITGSQVPVIDGTMSAQQLNQSVFVPVVLFPNDTLISSVNGSWGERATSTLKVKLFGKKVTLGQYQGNYSCDSVDLLGRLRDGSGSVVGNSNMKAGLMGSLVSSAGTVSENFMIKESPKKDITAQSLLLIGLNIAPSESNANWRNDLCMNLEVSRLEVARCVNANSETVKCPQ